MNLRVEAANIEKITSLVLKELLLMVILAIILEPDLFFLKKLAIKRELKQVWCQICCEHFSLHELSKFTNIGFFINRSH